MAHHFSQNLDTIKNQFQRAAAGDITTDEEGKMKGMPRVPTCTSEKVVATVLAANKNRIEDTNNNLIDGVDGFETEKIEFGSCFETEELHIENEIGHKQEFVHIIILCAS